MEKLTNFVSGSYKDVATKFRDELKTTQSLRGKFEGVARPTEDFLVASIEGNTANQTKAIADFTKGAIEIKDSFLSASESFVQNIIESRKDDLKQTYGSNNKPVNETKTVNVNVKVEGDANTAKMDKDQVTNALLQGLQDPNLSNELYYTIDGGSAPSAATGSKNK
jgi:preprotein translocase subunit Sec63